ncbi:MAG: hypothetical protein RIE73_28535 [Coleofasciculus sp. C1-SOL-03]
MEVSLSILAICRDVPVERLSGGTSLRWNRIKAGGQCPPYWF